MQGALQNINDWFIYFDPAVSRVAPYAAFAALVLSIVAIVLLLTLRRRFMRLSLGKAGSLEESIDILARDMKGLKDFRGELEKYLKLAETRLRGSVSGIGVVRFNPFAEGQGGNQSFCAAFLDEGGNGVVLSTLYARDRVGVYGKPVEAGNSSFELTAEEKQAIAQAQEQIARRKK